MNISNYNKNSYNSFGFNMSNKDKTLNSDKERMDFYTQKSIEVLLERMEREVPENGKFKTISTSFRIPGTQNFSILSIQYDEIDPKNKRYLSTNINREYTDKLYSKPLLTGTKNEIKKFLKEYMNNPEKLNEYKQNLKEFSNSVDEDNN